MTDDVLLSHDVVCPKCVGCGKTHDLTTDMTGDILSACSLCSLVESNFKVEASVKSEPPNLTVLAKDWTGALTTELSEV